MSRKSLKTPANHNVQMEKKKVVSFCRNGHLANIHTGVKRMLFANYKEP